MKALTIRIGRFFLALIKRATYVDRSIDHCERFRNAPIQEQLDYLNDRAAP